MATMTDLGGLKGLLFDKDGTLIDFFATWMPAYCLAADRIAAAAGLSGHADRLLLAGGYDRANDRLAPDSLLAQQWLLERLQLQVAALIKRQDEVSSQFGMAEDEAPPPHY